jgi:hypothetical protein
LGTFLLDTFLFLGGVAVPRAHRIMVGITRTTFEEGGQTIEVDGKEVYTGDHGIFIITDQDGKIGTELAGPL